MPHSSDLFRGLKPRSEFSLSEAVRILQLHGEGATLVILIPSDSQQPCDIVLATGPMELVLRPVQDNSKIA